MEDRLSTDQLLAGTDHTMDSQQEASTSTSAASTGYEGENTRGPPMTGNFPGEVNFKVVVNDTDEQRAKFAYSSALNRIYVDRDFNFNVFYHWDSDRAPEDMYVRATVVFLNTQDLQERVQCCLQHSEQTLGLRKEVAMNVLRSARALGDQGVYYCGNADLPDSWFSVCVYFHKSEAEPRTHAYKLMCLSSCASGISKRPIGIIFTLEDAEGVVYGRQSVNVKACRSARRDKNRDELLEGAGLAAPRDRRPRPQGRRGTTRAQRDLLVSPREWPSVPVPPQVAASAMRAVIHLMTVGGHHDPRVVPTFARRIAQLTESVEQLNEGATSPQ